MTDLERVLQGLDCVSGFGHCLQSEAFAGGICVYCIKEVAKKAKELLKKQEPKPVGKEWNECPSCGRVLDQIHNMHYCGVCGQAVKWDA